MKQRKKLEKITENDFYKVIERFFVNKDKILEILKTSNEAWMAFDTKNKKIITIGIKVKENT